MRHSLLIPATVMLIAGMGLRAQAQDQPVPLLAQAQDQYDPTSLPTSLEINDTLSSQDIPTGFGGFFRDYTVRLEAGDQVAIDVMSDEFDTVVSLIDANGNITSENDDGPDGTTNSLLFSRITQSGIYTVRIQSYAGQGEGAFYLKVARLREASASCTGDAP